MQYIVPSELWTLHFRRLHSSSYYYMQEIKRLHLKSLSSFTPASPLLFSFGNHV